MNDVISVIQEPIPSVLDKFKFYFRGNPTRKLSKLTFHLSSLVSLDFMVKLL